MKAKKYKSCKNCAYDCVSDHNDELLLSFCEGGYKRTPIRRNNNRQIVKFFKPLEPCKKVWKRIYTKIRRDLVTLKNEKPVIFK